MTEKKETRHVVHLDLDSFFVSVECLTDSRLKGKPLIVGGSGDRGVVASCSYEARSFGVRSAMPVKLAKQLCPHAITIRGDHEKYSRYSHLVTDIIREKVPLFEKASIDEFYLDLTGMDRFFGCMRYADELKTLIVKETGLPLSFGLSGNKTVSKIGTGEAKPDGRIHIMHGTEKPFLGPLSVRKIPGVGDKGYRLLSSMGVEKIETLQQMPPETIHAALGENGLHIWKKANGWDESPVLPHQERKSISTEETFEQDTTDVKKLEAVVVNMAEELCAQLRKNGKLASTLTVKIRYSDFNTHTKQTSIPYTSADHVVIPAVKELFSKLYDRRILIRLVGVKLSDLVNGYYQIDLFDDTQERLNLYQAMDKLNGRFGKGTVFRAPGLARKK
jgi:DNA polymerase-4